jgi:hypothetical protein
MQIYGAEVAINSILTFRLPKKFFRGEKFVAQALHGTFFYPGFGFHNDLNPYHSFFRLKHGKLVSQ